MSERTKGPIEVVDCACAFALRPVGTISVFSRVVDETETMSRDDAAHIVAARAVLTSAQVAP